MKKIENSHQNRIQKKLNICDYVFSYKNHNLKDGEIIYYFDKMEHVEYENGKRKSSTFLPIMVLEILATDESNQKISIMISLNMNIQILNKLSSKITKINENVVECEIFLHNSYFDNTAKQIYFDTETDKYSNPAFCWASKIEENKFLIKMSIPEENVFLWLHIDLNE